MSDTPERIYTNANARAIITPPAIPLHETDIEWVPAAKLAEVEEEQDQHMTDLEEALDQRDQEAARAEAAEEELMAAQGQIADAQIAQEQLTAARAALVTARNEALDEAADAINKRGIYEQECFGLNRATQNFFRARDIIRALATQTQDKADD